jgi:hypothetical protein
MCSQAWLGRTPGKLGTLSPNGGPYNAYLAASTVTLPNGSRANAQYLHDLCFGETGLSPSQHLPRSNWTCCHHTQVCDVPVHLPAEMYEDNFVGTQVRRQLCGLLALIFETKLSSYLSADNFVGAQGLKMLLERPSGQPWFMQVNWPGPHTPFIVTKEMMDSTRDRAFEPPVDYYHGPNSVEDNKIARRLYAAEVENLDQWFGKYIHATRQLGDYANTVVCISSDHGEVRRPWGGA